MEKSITFRFLTFSLFFLCFLNLISCNNKSQKSFSSKKSKPGLSNPKFLEEDLPHEKVSPGKISYSKDSGENIFDYSNFKESIYTAIVTFYLSKTKAVELTNLKKKVDKGKPISPPLKNLFLPKSNQELGYALSDEANATYHAHFIGWYNKKNDKKWNFNDPIIKNLKLYAKWEEKVFNVGFYITKKNFNSGTPPLRNQKVNKNSKIKSQNFRITNFPTYKEADFIENNKPYANANANYLTRQSDFLGWYYNKNNKENKFIFNQTKVNQNLKLYAKWKETLFNVKIYLTLSRLNNEEEIEQDLKIDTNTPNPQIKWKPTATYEQVKLSNLIDPDANCEAEVETFWYDINKNYMDDKKWDFNINKVKENITIYATWKKKTNQKIVNLLFYKMKSDHSPLKSIQVKACSDIKNQKPKISFGNSLQNTTGNLSRFRGWFTDNDKEWDFSKYITSNLKLHAKWTSVTQVSNTSHTDSTLFPPSTFPTNQEAGFLGLPLEQKKVKAHFSGWYDNNNIAHKKISPGETLNLHEKWLPKVKITTKNAKIWLTNPNSITNTEAGLVPKNTKNANLKAYFAGWFKSLNHIDPYKFNDPNFSGYLYGKWSETTQQAKAGKAKPSSYDPTSLYGLLYKPNKQSTNIDPQKIDTSKVYDMSNLFDNDKTNFNKPIGGWDTSNVKYMQRMFAKSNFNQPIGGWNTQDVRNMKNMFSFTKFDQNINSWNTSKVKSMHYMFNNAKKFNKPLNNWNVQNVKNMKSMFRKAEAFNQNINSWNTEKVKNMSKIFEGAKSFNHPLNQWNVKSLIKIDSMFSDANRFDQNMSNYNWNPSCFLTIENTNSVFNSSFSSYPPFYQELISNNGQFLPNSSNCTSPTP